MMFRSRETHVSVKIEIFSHVRHVPAHAPYMIENVVFYDFPAKMRLKLDKSINYETKIKQTIILGFKIGDPISYETNSFFSFLNCLKNYLLILKHVKLIY